MSIDDDHFSEPQPFEASKLDSGRESSRHGQAQSQDPGISIGSQRAGFERIVALAVAVLGVVELVAGIPGMGMVLLALAASEMWAMHRRRLLVDTQGVVLRSGVRTVRLPWTGVLEAHLERPFVTGFRHVIVTDDRGRKRRISGIGVSKRAYRHQKPAPVELAVDLINSHAIAPSR